MVKFSGTAKYILFSASLALILNACVIPVGFESRARGSGLWAQGNMEMASLDLMADVKISYNGAEISNEGESIDIDLNALIPIMEIELTAKSDEDKFKNFKLGLEDLFLDDLFDELGITGEVDNFSYELDFNHKPGGPSQINDLHDFIQEWPRGRHHTLTLIVDIDDVLYSTYFHLVRQ